MDIKNIGNFFNPKNTPKSGDYNIEQILDTNLYAVITKENSYGVMLSKIYEKPKFPKYKNLEIEYKDSIIRTNTEEKLDGCLIVIAGKDVEPKMFQDILIKYIGEKEKTAFYKSSNLKYLLQKLGRITQRIVLKKEAIIGAYGELHFLNHLIDESLDSRIKSKIIQSWESDESRTIIDFNFDYADIKIEVKTTTLNSRYHHIMDLAQLEYDLDGYLLSNCINEDKEGKTNQDIINEIRKKLDNRSENEFNDKIEMRGSECEDNTFKFKINGNLEPTLFDFNSVPKLSLIHI